MESFLKYVAQDILQEYGTDLSHVAVVFPNKRASLFLNEELMRQVGHPIWCPTYITISDLFRRHSNLQVADPIKLICDLHKTFIEAVQTDETLDHFYGWGQLLLADFDDIDKNMADAQQVFFNVETFMRSMTIVTSPRSSARYSRSSSATSVTTKTVNLRKILAALESSW